MDDRHLESRLLELAFTTEAPITATALAFFAPCSVQEATVLLDRLATAGTLRIESDDEGNIYYEMPNRQKLAAPTAQALARRPAATAGRTPEGARRAVLPSALVNPVMAIGAPERAAPLAVTPKTAGDLVAQATALGDAKIDRDAIVECPYCAEPIRAAARKCKHCGEMLDPALRQPAQPVQVNVQNVQTVAGPSPQMQAHLQAMMLHDSRYTSPGIAALLSIWPGIGHIYTGRVAQGLLWLFGVSLGYALIIPGLILHVVCMFNAANAARRDNAARARALLGAPDVEPTLLP